MSIDQLNIIGSNKDILTADEIYEMSEYIESLSNAPDNTNGEELIEYAAKICFEING